MKKNFTAKYREATKHWYKNKNQQDKGNVTPITVKATLLMSKLSFKKAMKKKRKKKKVLEESPWKKLKIVRAMDLLKVERN